MMLSGKKLLIIGGASQHCKVVESARRLGIETYVIDYLPYEKAPAKIIADHHRQINVTDYEAIRNLCLSEKIDGAIASHIDFCQRPYQRVCEMMGFPCFGSESQFLTLTDKQAFENCCTKNGVDVIPSYTVEDFSDEAECVKTVDFPVLVKPSDSRGSRGQSVCSSYDEVLPAIERAKRESSCGGVVIEKLMKGYSDFSVSYIVINGTPYLSRICDRFAGTEQDDLSRVCIAAVSPSRYSDMYLSHVDAKVKSMIADIGLKNAPVFMQGFIDGETVRFYDAGLRFAGGEYERQYEAATGVNVIDILVEFALTGAVSGNCRIPQYGYKLNGKISVQFSAALRAGTIAEIIGWEDIKAMPEVVSCFSRFTIGKRIEATHDLGQRFCTVDILCANTNEARNTISKIYSTLQVLDEHGRDMKTSLFSPELLNHGGTSCL